MPYLHIALCEECGKEFRHRSRNPDARKYCSAACRAKGSQRKRRTNAMMWRAFGEPGQEVQP